jgi:hypothetical protein
LNLSRVSSAVVVVERREHVDSTAGKFQSSFSSLCWRLASFPLPRLMIVQFFIPRVILLTSSSRDESCVSFSGEENRRRSSVTRPEEREPASEKIVMSNKKIGETRGFHY